MLVHIPWHLVKLRTQCPKCSSKKYWFWQKKSNFCVCEFVEVTNKVIDSRIEEALFGELK